MYETMEVLKADYNYQKRLMERFKTELQKLPKGCLFLNKQKGKEYLYIRVGDDQASLGSTNQLNGKLNASTNRDLIASNRSKLINTQEEKISNNVSQNELCKKIKRRRFIEKSLPILENNIKALNRCIKDYSVYSEEIVNSKLGKAYESTPMIVPKEEENRDLSIWGKLFSNQNPMLNEEMKHSIGDIKVRSKSEIIICKLLEAYDVPFKYETCLCLGKINYYPDFVVLNPIDNKLVYWEHFGMIKDKNYVENMERKLATYRVNGITLWDNLIITFDAPDGSLNVSKIERLIKAFFIPSE